SLAAGTYFYRIIPIDANGLQGPLSPISTSCTSNGSQACVVSFAPVPGQVATTLCRGPATNNITCASIAGNGAQFTGSSVTDNLASFNFNNSLPTVANGSSVVLGSAGLSATTLKVVGGGASSTVAGTFTANRAQSLPDVSGVVEVSSYVNSAFDN